MGGRSHELNRDNCCCRLADEIIITSYCNVKGTLLQRSLRQDHFSRLGLISILKAKKIDPTGQILGIKLEFVPSGRLMNCIKIQQFLSEEIEDPDANIIISPREKDQNESMITSAFEILIFHYENAISDICSVLQNLQLRYPQARTLRRQKSSETAVPPKQAHPK